MNTQQLADGSKQYVFHPITSIDVAIDNETEMTDLQAEMEHILLSAQPNINIYNGAWMFRSENQFLDISRYKGMTLDEVMQSLNIRRIIASFMKVARPRGHADQLPDIPPIIDIEHPEDYDARFPSDRLRIAELKRHHAALQKFGVTQTALEAMAASRAERIITLQFFDLEGSMKAAVKQGAIPPPVDKHMHISQRPKRSGHRVQ